MDFTPTFIAIAQFRLREGESLGEKLLDHVLHCGKCKHVGDDDLSVYLCEEAKELDKAFDEAKKMARPYAKASE